MHFTGFSMRKSDYLPLILLFFVCMFGIGLHLWYQVATYDPNSEFNVKYNLTDFGYEPDSVVYRDITQKMLSAGILGFWELPSIKQAFNYYFVVIVPRPLAHAFNLLIYSIYPDPQAFQILPLLTSVFTPLLLYLILREFDFSEFHSFIAGATLLSSFHLMRYSYEALFDAPALFLGLLPFYLWCRSVRAPGKRGMKEEILIGLAYLASVLYRQSNVIILMSSLAYDFFNHDWSRRRWHWIPVAGLVLLAPVYIYHWYGGWTFFTPNLSQTDYFGLPLLWKPIRFAGSFFYTYGMMGFIACIGLYDYLIQRASASRLIRRFKSSKITLPNLYALALDFIGASTPGKTPLEFSMFAYGLVSLGLNFVWAINNARFWLIAVLPVLFFAFRWLSKRTTSELLILVGGVLIIDVRYSIIASLLASLLVP